MKDCPHCGRSVCDCIDLPEEDLFAYPRDPESGEPGYVPEKAHYVKCAVCGEHFDPRDEQSTFHHRHGAAKG